jgi:hypothetical protein
MFRFTAWFIPKEIMASVRSAEPFARYPYTGFSGGLLQESYLLVLWRLLSVAVLIFFS